jgi:hypothetical protein
VLAAAEPENRLSTASVRFGVESLWCSGSWGRDEASECPGRGANMLLSSAQENAVMPTFFVRTIAPDSGVVGDWQEVEADTAVEAVEAVCGFPVAEGGNMAAVCAEARAGSRARPGKFYRRR